MAQLPAIFPYQSSLVSVTGPESRASSSPLGTPAFAQTECCPPSRRTQSKGDPAPPILLPSLPGISGTEGRGHKSHKTVLSWVDCPCISGSSNSSSAQKLAPSGGPEHTLKALHEVLPGWAPARGLEPSHLTPLSPLAICLLFPFSLFRQLRGASQGPQTRPPGGRTCWSALLEIPCGFREKRQPSPLKRGESSLCYKPCTPPQGR